MAHVLYGHGKGARTVSTGLPVRPAEPAVDIDIENDLFSWGGERRAPADLLTAANGSRYVDYGAWHTGTTTVVIEYELDEASSPSGHLFSWTSGYPSGNRVEVSVTTGGSGTWNIRIYNSRRFPSADYDTLPSYSKSGESGTRYNDGRRRQIIEIEEGEVYRSKSDNSVIHVDDNGSNSLSTPTRLAFGARAWASGEPDLPLANGTLHRVTIYNRKLTDAEIHALGQTGFAPAIHLLGDSFLNNYRVPERLKQILAADSRPYLAISQDGVGATTLTQQVDRFLSGDRIWRDATLVFCDFGFESDYDTAVAQINRATAALNHDRWLFMEPAPNQADGTGTRDDFDTLMGQLETFCGDHWVPTLAEAISRGDGSANDNAEIAKNLWPLSLKTSTSDFHPSLLGYDMLGDLVYWNAFRMGYL